MATNKKRTAASPFRYLPMDMARLVCAPLLLVYRLKRLTPAGEPYKKRIEGGAILAANHSAYSDTFVAGVTVWYRRMYFLAAEVVMKTRLRSWLLKGVGAIKIDRNQVDIDAIRRSVEVLKAGHTLMIFPEGGITEGEEIGTLKSGAALIALQAGVPIIPLHICPKKHWYSRRTVIIGDPIHPKEIVQHKFPTTADITNITDALASEMRRCAVQF